MNYKDTNKIVLIGGGTISHVRSHLALCAPAYGSTVTTLEGILLRKEKPENFNTVVKLTRMADWNSRIETNQDVEKLLDELIADPSTRVIVFNPALVDFDGQIGDIESGKYATRLETKNGTQTMNITPTDKLIGKIRKERKDIFVVGFKTTSGASSKEQYLKGLELLKKNSLNLVVANDTVTRNNMIIAPEETRYCETTNRLAVLDHLADMIVSRMNNTFTRSTVVDGAPVDWNSDLVPDNLRTVVNHCIKEGAYKPFLGKTAGHFAVKINDGEILTSIRKTNFNELEAVGLVRVEYEGLDKVKAHGAKPSVGGMSQRIIFTEHPEAECIVHFHSPRKHPNVHPDFELTRKVQTYPSFMTVPQWPNECGSHQCGKNTSDHLMEVNLGDGDRLKVVYLDNHGPNIVFGRKTPAEKVIKFINNNFNLKEKTGGLVT